MRVETIQNAVKIEYPDKIVQINDRNTIAVSSLIDKPVGAIITLTCNGESVTIQYDSELPFLLFRINSSLQKITNGQHQTVTVSGYVSNDGTAYQFTSFTMTVELGRTLNTRPHGCCRTMYYGNDSDLEKVNIFVPVSGTATVGQYVYTLQAGVNQLNLTEYNQTAITPPSGDFGISIALSYSHSEDPVFFGDMWKHANTEISPNTNYTINMVQILSGLDCESNSIPYGKIRFVDIDGCYKTFFGKLTKEKYSLKQTEYINNELVVNNPKSHITNVGDEVTIAFSDIAHSAYLFDIVYSTDIQYLNGYGIWCDCLLADSNLTESDPDTTDIEIKLKVLA